MTTNPDADGDAEGARGEAASPRPETDDPHAEYHQVENAEDIEHGEGMGVEIDGIEVAVFNVGGEYYAMSNRCAHQRAPMCKVGEKKINGELCWRERRGGVDAERPAIQCPWHLWEWDLETGEHVVSERRMATFDVVVDDGEVFVRV